MRRAPTSRTCASRSGSTGRCRRNTSSFVGRALTGDFGNSFRTGRPVLDEIAPRYLNTVPLGALALADRGGDRHGDRHRLGGAAPHRVRQYRAAAVARRRVDADVLPRPAADARLLGVAQLAAALRQGHVAALHPAGDHAEHGVDRGDLAHHACEPDRGAGRGLRADGARQGTARVAGDLAPCGAQRAHSGGDRRGAAARLPARRRGGDRDRVRLARARPAAGAVDPGARLSGGAGRGAAARDHVRGDQPRSPT